MDNVQLGIERVILLVKILVQIVQFIYDYFPSTSDWVFREHK